MRPAASFSLLSITTFALCLSFADAAWDGQRFTFSTILPEDEGTIGWELRIATPTTAVLKALTENGQPIQDELKWDMTR